MEALTVRKDILFNQDLKVSERLLLMALKCFEEQGNFPSMDKIAYTLGIHVRTVNVLISSLEEHGFITRTKESTNKKDNHYILNY